MAPQPIPDQPAPAGDPWAAFGYIVAGIAFYGALGWGLSVWTGASFWIPLGIIVGLGFGMYLVFARYRIGGTNSVAGDRRSDPRRQDFARHDFHPHDLRRDHDAGPEVAPGAAAPEVRPPRDDRGETS